MSADIRLSMLCSDVLLAVGSLDGADGEPRVSVLVDQIPVQVRSRGISYEHAAPEAGIRGTAIVLCLATLLKNSPLEVVFQSDNDQISVGPASTDAIVVDLRSMIRERLASLASSERKRVLGLVIGACRGHATLDPHRLSHSLHTLRETLREPSPTVQVRREEPRGLHVGAIVGLDEQSFYVRGWMRDAEAPITSLIAVSPEGARTSLLDHLCRVRRPDVDKLYDVSFGQEEKLGFIGTFAIDMPNHLPDGWIFEAESAVGVRTEVQAPTLIRDPLVARNTITGELAGIFRPEPELLEQIVPAVTTLQDRLAGSVEVEAVEEFGSPPETPKVSIVVPVYQRIDLIEHQMAQFADDSEIRESDLIYVLDSPELADRFLSAAGDLHELYRIPFRVAVLSHHGGFAVATNRGATLARGGLLLLSHSDVMARSRGWLGGLSSFFDSKPRVGAAGPKLLYDDDSIQHAGVYFRRAFNSAPWEKAHYFKGLHREVPAANVSRQVPALADACMLVELDVYRELEGLSHAYVPAGFEGSDLCMRLREAGREIWYVANVELYHVEGQSYSPRARGEETARYGAWVHTRLWGNAIEDLTTEEAPAATAT